MVSLNELEDIATLLRRDVLQMTSSAGSGHPSSCLSSADIFSYIFFNEMRFDVSNPNNSENDEFVLSKGHAAPLLYAGLFRAGCIKSDLLRLRKLDSVLEGHPVPSSLGWIKLASGSLGQGLSVALGMALAAKLSKRKFRTYVLMGDSECSEGSVWEAAQLAGHYQLDNLIAIVDINRLGQRGETMLGHNIKSYQERFESFGWSAIQIDGHNFKQIQTAFDKARSSKKPVVILAKTIKGKGVSFMEDKNGWHGRALNDDELQKALKQLPEVAMPQIKIFSPDSEGFELEIKKYRPLIFKNSLATREAYGQSLAALAESDPSLIALDAEVSNSTHAEEVKKIKPKQFLECFIAEQNMIGMAQGLSLKGYNVFASSFSAFLTRAHDQLRMAGIANSNLTVCGSHAGVSIGEDGASQMGLEDIAMFRSIPGSIIFYPSDAVSTQGVVQLANSTKGMKYIRTTRPKTPLIYASEEKFELGDFKVLRQYLSIPIPQKKSKAKNTKKIKFQPKGDSIVLIGSGITLHECLSAHEILKKRDVSSAVIDLYCIKPLNIQKLIDFIRSHGNKVIVAEDHYKEGGIGEMLASALSNSGIQIKTLAVDRIPHSGTKDQLLEKYSINSRAIVEEAKKLLEGKN